MSSDNPFPSPSIDSLNPSATVRIAKAFRYLKDASTKDMIFNGAVFAAAEGLYISHDKHSRQSAGAAMALFGLLGAAVQHFLTRNKTFDYPFPILPAEDLSAAIRDRMIEHKFNEKSVVSIIPKSQIDSFSSSFNWGKKFIIGDIELMLISPVKMGLKQLPELGYNQPE